MKSKLILLLSSVLLFSGICLSPQPPISVYGWADGNCIDTGKCVPME